MKPSGQDRGEIFKQTMTAKRFHFLTTLSPDPLPAWLHSWTPPLRDFRPPGFLHAMALSQMKLPGAANAGEAKKLTDNLALAIFLFLFIYLFKSKRAKRPLTLQ